MVWSRTITYVGILCQWKWNEQNNESVESISCNELGSIGVVTYISGYYATTKQITLL